MRNVFATVTACAILSAGSNLSVYAQDGQGKAKSDKADIQKHDGNNAKKDSAKRKNQPDAHTANSIANNDGNDDTIKKKNHPDTQTSVDNRQGRQAKRIAMGIKKGSLTPDEITKLQDQQKNISNLETSLKADGDLSKDDMKRLQDALNEASRTIWTEKHDADGKKTTVERLGKDVSINPTLSAKLAGGNLGAAEAKSLLGDFSKATELKRNLSSGTLDNKQRAKNQDEYDSLLNKYFEAK